MDKSQFTKKVQDIIPFLAAEYPQISQIISNITGVSTQQVIEDLQWGFGAEIVIEQLGVNSYGNEIRGLFNPNNPKTIKIDVDLVNMYENANENDSAPLQLLITYSVLLHELVHYEDYQFDNIMQNNIELGLYFEYLYMGGYYELNENGNVIFIIED